MAAFKEVTHVIFDMDGLLLNTEHLYTRATQEICDPYGKTYTWELKQTLMGMTGVEVAKKITKELNLPVSPEEYLKLAQEKYEKLFPQSEMMSGAEKLVRHLKKEGVHIAVATSSSIESYNLKTNHHKEFFALFEHIVNGSSDPEVKAGKPDPSIFLVCASRFADKPSPEQATPLGSDALAAASLSYRRCVDYLSSGSYPSIYLAWVALQGAINIAPASTALGVIGTHKPFHHDKCLVLEDAPNGVKAALAAGMQVVMVPDPLVSKSLTQDATLTLSSLEELRPELFGLPPFAS